MSRNAMFLSMHPVQHRLATFSSISRARAYRQLDEQHMGYQRTTFMFERTGSKRIFERFLGEMATLSEERPFHVLEVIPYIHAR